MQDQRFRKTFDVVVDPVKPGGDARSDDNIVAELGRSAALIARLDVLSINSELHSP
jgi:hypothetical protein